MEIEEAFKYIIWIVFFGIVLAGLYSLLKKLGIL